MHGRYGNKQVNMEIKGQIRKGGTENRSDMENDMCFLRKYHAGYGKKLDMTIEVFVLKEKI